METLRGVVHGRMIELDNELGLPDGQPVTVVVQPTENPREGAAPSSEGLRRAFGAWAEDAKELDDYLEWNRRQRKFGRPEIEP
jgi:hypothetical protein